jgi:DNA-binding NarL/FixJ family response regulator
MERQTTVLISSNNALLRAGIKSILSNVEDIQIFDVPKDRLELLECVYTYNPDIVILSETDLLDSHGSEIMRLVLQKAVQTKFLLIIKAYDEDKELAWLKAGVKGFLTANTGNADFIKCIRAVKRGELWVRRKLLEKYIEHLSIMLNLSRKDYSHAPSLPSFSRREMDVFIMVGRNYRNKEIAEKLSISEKTVKHYVARIFRKLNVKTRKDIRRYLSLAV